ncbi:MAG: thermopsin family protease [Thermoplasmata archaeon]|nr:thermopsin family protease [Thermoplasmata archaeon]
MAPPSGIDLAQWEHSEPLAMGIGDFGETPTGVPYEFSTPIFRATALVNSIDDAVLYDCGPTVCQDPLVSAQLNLNLVFVNGSRTMDFWVQNAPILNTTNSTVQILHTMIDNVWNASSVSGLLPPSTLTGNGSVYGESYYQLETRALPGLNVNLSDPTLFEVQTKSATSDGVPYVVMQYNDGFGWQTYDNVSFPWARGWTDQNFVVDGFHLVTRGDPDDADWTIVGPGKASTATDFSSDSNLTLEYWNGHNFQAVTNAYNFGITAETSDNAISQAALNATSGTPAASFGAGSGAPGPLYGVNQIALLNVSAAPPDGTLYVNGVPTPYVGGQVNLTLDPGSYSLRLQGQGTAWPGNATANVTLSAGEYLPLNFIWQDVWFNETGLPLGTEWTLTVNGTTYRTTTGTIEMFLPEGVVSYSVGAQPGFTPSNGSGNLAIGRMGAALTILWLPVPYTVDIGSQGLPTCIGWSVAIGGTVYRSSTNESISVELPNGSFAYEVIAGSYAYLPTQPFGNFSILGSPYSFTATFAPRYAVLSGTVEPADASVWLDGTLVPLVRGGFLVQLAAGVYEVNATESGYAPISEEVTLTPANLTTVPIVLQAIPSTPGPVPAPSTPAVSSGVSPLDFAGLAIAGVAIGVLAAIVLARRRPASPP